MQSIAKFMNPTFPLLLLFFFAIIACSSVHAFEPAKVVTWKTCEAITNPPPPPTTTEITEVKANDLPDTQSMENSYVMKNSRMFNENIERGTENMATSAAPTALCTFVDLPFSWNNSSDGRKVSVFVKKFSAKKKPAVGQLWLLQGGPGYGGDSFDIMATTLRDELVTYDIMLPDQRGTARSSYLECATGSFDTNNLTDAEQCWDEIQKRYSGALSEWGTTNAAKDVLHLQSITKPSSDSIFAVYGASYGSFLLNRILTLSPNTVNISIFDSVVPPDADSNERDKDFLETGEKLLRLCRASEDCNGRFMKMKSKSVDSVLATVMKKQADKNTACVGKVYTPDAISKLMARFLLHKYYRRLVFPTFYRLARCSKRDRNWLTNLGEFVVKLKLDDSYDLKLGANGPSPYSSPIFNIITVSELTRYPVRYSTEDWNEFHNSTYFNANLSKKLTQRSIAFSSKRYVDTTEANHTDHRKPVLTIQSSLDPITHSWNQIYNRTNNYLVVVPNAMHGVVYHAAQGVGDELCALNIMINFIKNSTVAPSTLCINKTEDAEFRFSQLWDKYDRLTGISPLWDSGPARTFQQARYIIIGTVVAIVIAPCCLFLIISVMIFGVLGVTGCRDKTQMDSSIVPILTAVVDESPEPDDEQDSDSDVAI